MSCSISKHKNQFGFTIVELLIVIVVIGILAAITAVAYNGIQNRARANAASSALTQAAKKIAVWQVDNPGQSPGSLSEAGISAAGDVSYQYSQRADGQYCITATVGSISYKITESSSPSAGGCNGHGQGGVAAVTNLIMNPNAELNTSNVVPMGSQGVTLSRVTDRKYAGDASFKVTANGISAGPKWMLSIAPGSQFRWSAYVYSQSAISLTGFGETYVGSTYTGVSPQTGNPLNIPANTWTRVSWTGTHPTGANSLVGFGMLMAGGAGQVIWVDNVMVTTGTDSYAYADGNSPNWVWNGTVNNSTSTGPLN